MADYDYSEEGETIESSPLATATQATAAVVSLALIAGVGVWGYDLMMRDVSGIPVVRAVEGEMRIRPEDPGGQLARHQGLAVNEIAAHGQAGGPVDQVKLAPPEVALTSEDRPVIPATEPAPVPMAEAIPEQSTASQAILRTETGVETAVSFQTGTMPSGQSDQDTIDALVAELMSEATDGTSPTDGAGVGSTQTAEASALSSEMSPEPAVLTRDPDPAVAVSARPRLRPQNVAFQVRQPAAQPAVGTNEIDPAAIPSGTRLAQLGAYESADVARAEWVGMEGRFGDILAGKSRVVQRAESNGRAFYRLRAMGFVDLADTRRFCSAVKAEGVDCIPVQVR